MNPKQSLRLSTHYLAMASIAFCAAMGWMLNDPAHLKTVNDLTHGHAALIELFNGLVMLFNLLHNPRTMKLVEAFGENLVGDDTRPATEPYVEHGISGAAIAGPESVPASWSPRKPPQPVQYAPEEAMPQPPENG